MLTACCHCGAVKIEIARKPRVLTRCTCSICRRYGALWAYCTDETALVICEADAITPYRWGDKTIEFCHCNTCGCMTHYRGTEKVEYGRIAVNMRMAAPEAIADIRVRTFDGADTWEYIETGDIHAGDL